MMDALKVWCCYAYSPRETANARGANHLMLDLAGGTLDLGRIRRRDHQTLCGKRFWGLDGGRSAEDFRRYGCARCAEIARRITSPILVHEKSLETVHGTVTWVPKLAPLYPEGE